MTKPHISFAYMRADVRYWYCIGMAAMGLGPSLADAYARWQLVIKERDARP